MPASKKLEHLAPGLLRPDPANARLHSESQIAGLMRAIADLGFHSPIVIDRENQILCGHGRLEAATRLSLKTVPCIRVTGLTISQRRALMLSDNRISDSGEDDPEKLRALLAEVLGGDFERDTLAAFGFSSGELSDAAALAGDVVAVDDDEFEPPPPSGVQVSGDFKIPKSEGGGEALRTPLVFHGGKSRLVPYLRPLVDSTPHSVYAEVCAGGLALFWARRAADGVEEYVNDLDGRIVNFWLVLKTKFEDFVRYASDRGIVSESLFRQGRAFLQAPGTASDVELAWALWYCCAVSHSHKATSFSLYPGAGSAAALARRLESMARPICARLRGVVISDRSVFDSLRLLDRPETLFYVDPPYPNTDQSFYGEGFTEEDFAELLDALAALKGRFILSSFPLDALEEFSKDHGWKRIFVDSAKNDSNGVRLDSAGDIMTKREVITVNFDPRARGENE